MGGKAKAPPTPDYAALAKQQGADNKEATETSMKWNRYNQIGPQGSNTWAQDPDNPDKWTNTTTLSPEQQRLYDAENRINEGLMGTAERGLGRVDEMMGTKFDISGLPGAQYNVDLSERHNLGALPEASDETRKRVEEALYKRQQGMLDPRFAAAEKSLANKLSNKGFAVGSGAYNTENEGFAQGKNNAYASAMMDAIVGGGAEQSRLLGDQLNVRRQGQSENQQDITNRFANANLNNQQRGVGIQELLMQRQLPLNELNALRTGSQAMIPQFGTSQGTAGAIAPAPTFAAGQAQYGADMDAYNAKKAQGSMIPGMIGSLAGSFFGPMGAAAGGALGKGMFGGGM